jgi:hypothetical protein
MSYVSAAPIACGDCDCAEDPTSKVEARADEDRRNETYQRRQRRRLGEAGERRADGKEWKLCAAQSRCEQQGRRHREHRSGGDVGEPRRDIAFERNNRDDDDCGERGREGSVCANRLRRSPSDARHEG